MNIRSIGLVCLVLAVAPVAAAQAQLVQYEFTGTRFSGNTDLGDVIYGVVTLDLGASPYSVQPFTPDDGGGQYGAWRSVDDNFTLDAVTSDGHTAGSALGGDTYFEAIDDPFYTPPFLNGNLHTHAVAGGQEIGMYFISQNYGEAGNGVPEVSDWTPLDDDETFIRIYFSDIATQTNQFSDYRLATFDPIRDTIVIDGIDTGVEDFEYEGKLVSERIDDLADSAKSHGQFVSGVNKLTRELLKAGLLTVEERDAISSAASDSDIGRKKKR